MTTYMCMGDFICLYCENTNGYVYSDQTSSVFDGLFVYTGQDRDEPLGVPNVHAITFQVSSQNRYKLTKRYRRLVEQYGEEPDDTEIQNIMDVAKNAAKTETQDNETEQARLQGKLIRYGDTIQLRHVFTNKFVHVSSTDTSRVDKSKMMVTLQTYSSKHAQFRILPRYKVKTEGELIEIYDQIVFESVKSPEIFLHASEPYRINRFTIGSELNVGIERAGFTWVHRYRPKVDKQNILHGSAVVRLFHKDLEAFLTAEGVFGEEPTEEVHLRIRERLPSDPRTLYNPKSAITYWQVESATSVIDGGAIKWENSIRFRHMTTRRYLYITPNRKVALTTDGRDPQTVFRIHSLSQKPEQMEISYGSNGRIEHVVSGCWLHAPIDADYKRQQGRVEKEDSLDCLQWDGASLIKVVGSSSRQYPDAFTVQKVAEKEWNHFNYVAGMIPFIKDLTECRKEGNDTMNARQTLRIIATLKSLRNFVMPDGTPIKDRQKLLRNLRLVDVMVDLLETPITEELKDFSHLCEVFRAVYEVLHCYTMGRSKKNALYFAHYIPFFMTQLLAKGGVGIQCCRMLIDILRDNRKIIDRFTPSQLDQVIGLLGKQKHHIYLELLRVLSVCQNIAMAENQTQIAVNLLQKQKGSMYHIELGQDVGEPKELIYVSINNRKRWIPLHKFAYKSNVEHDADSYKFLETQLALYKDLCYGRNSKAIEVITRNREFFTWEVAFLGVRSEVLPDRMRATFCDLLIGLFVDVGDNYSIIEVASNNFVYDEVYVDESGTRASDNVPHDLDSHFPMMRVWLFEFFDRHRCLAASEPSRNILIKEVLRLVTTFIKYGFFGSTREMDAIITPVIHLIDGHRDVPFPPDKGTDYSNEQKVIVSEWRKAERYKPGPNTAAMIEAKIRGLDLIDLLLVKEFNLNIRYFVSVFKDLEQRELQGKKRRKKLGRLLYNSFDTNTIWKSSKLRKRIYAFLAVMEKAEVINSTLTDILFDLTKYKSDEMIRKTLSILNKIFSMKSELFRVAERTQVLKSVQSVRVHRDALRSMVVLTRLSKSKLSEETVREMVAILDNFTELCHVPHKPHLSHPVGQNILLNNGLLGLLLPLVTQEVDTNLQDQFAISERVIGTGLRLLRFLTQHNGFVQEFLMDRIEELLSVQCCGAEQALALHEVFRGKTVHCLRLQPQHIQKIVRLAGHYQQRAPQFLQLLMGVMKMDVTGTLLKRNQHLVTKNIMENYKSVAYVMNMEPMHRLRVIIGSEGPEHQTYYGFLVALLATCAEGESQYVESLCQTLMSLDELFLVLNNRNVAIGHKVAFARYLVWAYMRTGRSAVESGVDELSHDDMMWKHIRIIWTLLRKHNTGHADVDKVKPSEGHSRLDIEDTTDSPASNDTDSLALYMLRAGFLVLQSFFDKFYKPNKDIYPEEIETLNRLATVIIPFAETAGHSAENHGQLQGMVACMDTLFRRLHLSKSVLENVFDSARFYSTLSALGSTLDSAPLEQQDPYELELNEKLHNFGYQIARFLEGRNTICAQLGGKTHGNERPYLPSDLEVKFPQGVEFQTHVQSFGNCRGKAIIDNRAYKLIDQLEISARKLAKRQTVVDDTLDIRCLQILRALMYNLIVQLPENWGEDVSKHQRILDDVKQLQDMMVEYDVVRKVLPLLERINLAVGLQVLSFIDLLLFNANRNGQEAMLRYFKATAEEVFFLFLRARIHDAVTAAKERRSIELQKKEMAKLENKTGKNTTSLENESSHTTSSPGQKHGNWNLDRKARKKKSLAPFFHRMVHNRLLVARAPSERLEEVEVELVTSPLKPAVVEDDVSPLNGSQDGSSAVLALRVMARLCDGQYSMAQTYLRTQPDNPISVNLVAELIRFLGTLYTHVRGDSIGLACQIFSTINEICQGVQENRAVALNNKIIDYINFIFRMPSFPDCEPEEVIELKTEMGNILVSLIEENDVASLQLAKEIRDTVDTKALVGHLVMVHSLVTGGRADPIRLICGINSTEPTESKTGIFSNKADIDKDLFESVNSFGFLCYIILARLFDIDRKLEKEVLKTPKDRIAFRHFRDQCMSVEVIKDECIQKVHFRVKERDLLREEVKEEVKWNIDRTSPSNKLRALLAWTKDILKDISYQKRILSNPFPKQLAKRWAIWNYACILLSLLIQVMMLATWYAPMYYADIPTNATQLPPQMTQQTPRIEWDLFQLVLWIVGACHNLCSLMLFISYLLLRHPALPNVSGLGDKLRKLCKTTTEEEDDPALAGPVAKTVNSRLQAKLFSATTLYYLLLMALSFAGTFFYGYFFAFHLVNIVANNELLKGVIKAITQNGKSLLWVMIMGLIIIYLYGLIGFAFLRPIFNPEEELYCNSLAQCIVTVLRYGVVGGISETFRMHDLQKNFQTFGMMTVYQLTFFILFTTIGLNIIFGIIVDTFSELRDLKWMAEKDMRDTCFICSRDSYDFEHEGLGFIYHVQQEHNMWAYVFYFLYLSQVKPNDYTSIEKHVATLLKQDKLDFFPLNRALCLSYVNDSSQDSQLNNLMQTLQAIKSKQDEDEQRRSREAERQRQAVWQEQFRFLHKTRSSSLRTEDALSSHDGESTA